MRWRPFCLVAVLAIAAGLGAAHAQDRRVALVIGNGAYEDFAPLANPAADAAALGERLSALGFETLVRTDLPMRGMIDAFKAFRQTARGADLALLYYAGHGRQAAVGGRAPQNYLFPVDARPDAAIDLAREAITIDEVFTSYLAPSGAERNLVLVDAARPVDLWGEGFASDPDPAAGPGFAAVLPRTEQWLDYEIWFASEPGTAADDGAPGTSSPFAAALMAALDEPGLDTDDLFRRIAALMRETPGVGQRPAPFGRLSAPIALHHAGPGDAPTADGIPDLTSVTPSAGAPAPAPAAAAPDEEAPDIPAPIVAAVETDAEADPAEALEPAPAPDRLEPPAGGPTGVQLEALLAWSRQQLEAGQHEGAVTALEQVLQYQPDNLEAWLTLGDALLARGDYHEAMQAFRQRASLDLEPPALIDVGDALVERGHPQQAAMHFLMALTMAEASGDAGTAALARERIDAVATATAAVTADDRAREQLREAWAAVEAGRYADAETVRATLLSDRPGMAGEPELDLLAAEIAQGQGRTEDAEALYARVAEADAGGELALRAEQALDALAEEREREALARADEIPVSALQWAMKALGHYAGPIDDNFGPTSLTAARAFQERIGAEQTGELTDEQKVLLVRMAAEAGQAESQNTLGIMYATGVGVSTDVDQARRWWGEAAAQGFAKAEDNLARLDR